MMMGGMIKIGAGRIILVIAVSVRALEIKNGGNSDTAMNII